MAKEREDYEPLSARAKMIGDVLWERASKLAEAIAPEVPSDAEELDEHDQWMILELAAQSFSEMWWEDPDALESLFELRKKFTGQEHPWLREQAKKFREVQKRVPDISISPQNPEWDAMVEKLGVNRAATR